MKKDFNKDDAKHIGRVAGVPNKISSRIKQVLAESLDADDGGLAFFLKLKESEPKVYANLISKLLPRQLVSADDGPLIPKEQSFDESVDVVRRILFMMAETEKRAQEQIPEKEKVSILERIPRPVQQRVNKDK